MKTLLPLLLLALPASAGFEADLAASWRGAGRLVFERPAAPPAQAAQVKVYERGGFDWESEARTAASSAESGLRAAGLPVLSSKVYKEDARYAFTLEYAEDGTPRPIESYQGASFSFESDARVALNAATSNLTAAGYHVLLARTKRLAGDYTYAVDFVARRRD